MGIKSFITLLVLAVVAWFFFGNDRKALGLQNATDVALSQPDVALSQPDVALSQPDAALSKPKHSQTPKELTPFETAASFWSLSKKGDFQAVEALITTVPSSYWVDCEETPASKAFKERQAKKLEGLPVLSGPSDAVDPGSDPMARIKLLKESSKLTNADQFEDLELVEQRIYGDEALVKTKYRITDNYFVSDNFLMTRLDGIWKIFEESNSESDHYASKRPKCPDK
jgi:hypothetical protein